MEKQHLAGATSGAAPAQRRTLRTRILYHLTMAMAVVGLLLVSTTHLNIREVGQQQTLASQSTKKNIIFMLTDGMGPASLSLTRSFRQYTEGLPIDDVLVLDKHLIGQSRTRSSDSLVTDSAAGATAFSCAMKTYNNAVAVTPELKPCGTLLEAMKYAGYMTGLAVTTRITDATPAAFSAHVSYRFYEDLVAQHQLGDYPLGRVVDLMIGGGRSHFYPASATDYGSGGLRADTRNLIEEAKEAGWTYAGNRSEFDSLALGENVQLPLLALLADNNIPFELDRDDTVYPSLEEEAITAMKALSEATKDSDKGFFLLIEGSRIDHAGHNNDPAAQVREVLAYDRAFKAVLDFVDSTDVETIVISTSDHETGGLALARQFEGEEPEYLWYPESLYNASHSGEYLNAKLAAYEGDELEEYIKHEIFEKDLGVYNYTDDEVTLVAENFNQSHFILNDIVSRRAHIGWSTHGHSAVDVNIYAYSNKEHTMFELYKSLGGNHENIEIGEFMKNYVGMDLEHITGKIQETQVKPDDAELLDYRVGEKENGDSYHSQKAAASI